MSKDNTPPKPPSLKEVKEQLKQALVALDAAKAAEQKEMVDDKAPFADKKDTSGWLGYSQDVYDKFFAGYKKIADMIDGYQTEIATNYSVVAPHGRRRTMYRMLIGSSKYTGDAKRRAVNSPIQGVSSEGGVIAGYLIQREVHKFMREWGLSMSDYTCYCRAVHDATYSETAYAMLLPELHINQHCAAVMVPDYFEKHLGFRPILSPEVEISIGASDARAEDWNWVLDDLPPIITRMIDERIKDGYLPAKKRQATLDSIFEWWVDPDKRAYLQENYPLLGVADLDKPIRVALKRNGITPRR